VLSISFASEVYHPFNPDISLQSLQTSRRNALEMPSTFYPVTFNF
jgi:hypothetical protein